jgi:hypothetical protein
MDPSVNMVSHELDLNRITLQVNFLEVTMMNRRVRNTEQFTSACLPSSALPTYPPNHLPTYIYIYLSIHLPTYSSTFLTVYLGMYLFNYKSLYSSFYLCAYLST